MTSTKYLIVVICVTAYFVEGGLINHKAINSQRYQSDPKKRPFCNAFTGCGRKRSSSSGGPLNTNSNINNNNMDVGEPINDEFTSDSSSLGDLLDLNSEPAVEELMRQIMSQAKLWEAIQEANQEMTLQKINNDKITAGGYNNNNNNNNRRKEFPLTFNAQ